MVRDESVSGSELRLGGAKPIPHDASYKAIFSFKRAVQDLLRFLLGKLPEDARRLLDQLDLSEARETKTEFVDEFFRRHLGDKVWEVPFRTERGDRRVLRVVLVLEFQSSIDQLMAVRVDSFASLFFQDEVKARAAGEPVTVSPLLAVVIYNGAAKWTAKRSMAELVGLPAGERRLFVGERYELVDIRAQMRSGRTLPRNNVLSLVMRTETMAEREGEPGAIVEEIAGVQDEGLRKTVLKWFTLTASRHDIDVDFLQDEEEFARLMAEGILRTVADECFERRFALLRAEGLEQGLERGVKRQRRLLRRLAKSKFGGRTADRLAGMLTNIDDPRRLEDVGLWIINCEESDELLGRLEAAS